MLEERDDADAAVNRISEAHVGFVSQGVDGVLALMRVELVEQLRDVAGAKHLVDVRKLLGLVRWEVRREYALRLALPPEKLTCRTW